MAQMVVTVIDRQVLIVPWPIPRRLEEGFAELFGRAVWDAITKQEIYSGQKNCIKLEISIYD